MKTYLKMFGAEALYLLASVIVAGLAALLQMAGRTYEGDYSSFIWSGSEYRYNAFFYILGMALFVGFMIAGYRFFLRERISALGKAGIAPKIIFPVIAVIFAVLMLAAIVLVLFLMTGLTDNMRPDWMLNLTCFGWPVFTLTFMIVTEILAVNNH
ncbi:MAG: hypothetical protein K5779_01520 [Saccharofermentans sp.]|nr:hypothetical protein [Saccharofermentans sp.]